MTDFSSIDRLVEFGLGMGVATQMVNTMNQTMNSMQVAGVNTGTTGQQGRPCAPAAGRTWYVVAEGRQAGPLTDHELSQLIGRGKIEDDTLMWSPGMTGWQLACNIPEVNKLMLLQS